MRLVSWVLTWCNAKNEEESAGRLSPTVVWKEFAARKRHRLQADMAGVPKAFVLGFDLETGL